MEGSTKIQILKKIGGKTREWKLRGNEKEIED